MIFCTFVQNFSLNAVANRGQRDAAPKQIPRHTLSLIHISFAGAGTTVLAAVQEGYEAVGIEMSDAYFQRSAERLKTALAADENAE